MRTDDILLVASVAAIVFCFVYIALLTERRLRDIEYAIDELAGVIVHKNMISEANAELAKTVNELADKNEELHRKLLLANGIVQSDAPAVISEKRKGGTA